jgi:hypothetical protein
VPGLSADDFPNGIAPWGAERQQALRRANRDKKNPRLPVQPFRTWLQNKVQEIGVAAVAASASTNDRTIRTFLSGYYWKDGKKYEVKHVRQSTVEKFMDAFAETPALIYEVELLRKYRAAYHDDRYRRSSG